MGVGRPVNVAHFCYWIGALARAHTTLTTYRGTVGASGRRMEALRRMFDDNAKGWQEKLEEYVAGRGIRV